SSFRQGMIKSQVKSPLRFCKPADPAVRKRRIPLVPKSAQLMMKLCSARQLKPDIIPLTLETDPQRRFGIGDLGNLSQVFKPTVGPRNRRPTKGANNDDRRACLKLDRRRARRTICLQ